MHHGAIISHMSGGGRVDGAWVVLRRSVINAMADSYAFPETKSSYQSAQLTHRRCGIEDPRRTRRSLTRHRRLRRFDPTT